MRVADRGLPIGLIDPAPNLARWPVRPVVAIESPQVLWDDGHVWDDATLETLWDLDYRDASCELFGLTVETGAPDDHGTFPAGHATVELDNRTGVWSAFNVDGSSSAHGPGARIHIYAHAPAGDWWIFSGTIARWDQTGGETLHVEAFDAFSDLAQPVGTYTPGTVGQLPGARLAAIVTAAQLTSIPTRFAAGTVTLTVQATDQAPVEEMEIVVSSDGGMLYCDADGTVTSYDRTWRAGRSDQVTVPVVSDNVCTADVILWDPVLTTADDGVADRVVLQNVALLRATAGSGRLVYTDVDLQWSTQTEGDVLAAFTLDQHKPPRIALDEATVWLFDPHQPDLWRLVDTRLFDKWRILHDAAVVGGVARLDVNAIVTTVVHDVTVEGGWTMTVGTTPATGYTAPILYDTGHLYDTGDVYGY